MSTTWKVVSEIVGCIVIFSYSQAASNFFQIRSHINRYCHDAVLINKILTGGVKTTPSALPKDLYMRFGYESHIKTEVMTSMQAWSKAKWISVSVTIILIGLTSLMGSGYSLASGLVAIVAGVTQSTSVNDAVIDEVATLARLVQGWYRVDDLGCRNFCFNGANENLFGNMFHVVDRLEASEN